jgi:hypothetical protein
MLSWALGLTSMDLNTYGLCLAAFQSEGWADCRWIHTPCPSHGFHVLTPQPDIRTNERKTLPNLTPIDMADAPPSTLGRRPLEDALQSGPRKKASVVSSLHFSSLTRHHRTVADPLVHHGRHFGQVGYAFCSVKVLITNGLLRLADEDHAPLETVA